MPGAGKDRTAGAGGRAGTGRAGGAGSGGGSRPARPCPGPPPRAARPAPVPPRCRRRRQRGSAQHGGDAARPAPPRRRLLPALRPARYRDEPGGVGDPAALAAPELEQLFNRRWEPRAPKVGQSTARCGDAAGQSGGTKRQPRVPAAAPGPELRGSTWARAGGHAVGARPKLGVGGTAGGPGKRGSDKAWGSAGSGRAPLLGCRENKKQNKAKSSQPVPLGNGGRGSQHGEGSAGGEGVNPTLSLATVRGAVARTLRCCPRGCGSEPRMAFSVGLGLSAGKWPQTHLLCGEGT